MPSEAKDGGTGGVNQYVYEHTEAAVLAQQFNRVTNCAKGGIELSDSAAVGGNISPFQLVRVGSFSVYLTQFKSSHLEVGFSDCINRNTS